MICAKCNKDLAECVCEDAEARFHLALKNPYVAFGAEYVRRILANIEKQKILREEESRQE